MVLPVHVDVADTCVPIEELDTAGTIAKTDPAGLFQLDASAFGDPNAVLALALPSTLRRARLPPAITLTWSIEPLTSKPSGMWFSDKQELGIPTGYCSRSGGISKSHPQQPATE